MKKMFIALALLLCGNGMQAAGPILDKIAEKGNLATKQLAAVLLLELYSTKLFAEHETNNLWAQKGQDAIVDPLAALEAMAVKKESSLKGLVAESSKSGDKRATAAQVLADYEKIYFSISSSKDKKDKELNKVVYGTEQTLSNPLDLRV
jgi:hypothetical protein